MLCVEMGQTLPTAFCVLPCHWAPRKHSLDSRGQQSPLENGFLSSAWRRSRWTGARIWVAGQPLTALLGSSFPHANRHLTPRWLIRHAHCVWAHLALATAQKILPFAQDFMFTYHPLFVSCACCNKLPQTERPKIIHIYCLTVWRPEVLFVGAKVSVLFFFFFF